MSRSPQVVFKSNNGPLLLTSGTVGSMQSLQSQITYRFGGQVDTLAHNLIGSVNDIHASGQGNRRDSPA